MDINQSSVLLVEDEALIALSEKKDLEEYGYKVRIAHRGEEAVTLFSEDEETSLILMDIDLGPGMNGTEAAKRILEIREVPIIFVSAHTEPYYVEKTEEITSYGYIAKNSGKTILNTSIKMAFRLFESRNREKEKEKKLAESSENLKATLNSIGDAVIATNTQGTITRMNPIAEKLTGWKKEEAIGQHIGTVVAIYNASTNKQIDPPVKEAIKQGKPIGLSNHTILISKNGHKFQIADSASPITNKTGKTIGVVLVFRDVTEEHEMQQRIQESEERFANVLGTIPDMVSIHDQDFNILYSNWHGFGNVTKEIKKFGTKCYKTYRGLHSVCPDCKAKTVLESKVPFQAEVKLPDDKWIDLRVLPMFDKNNNCNSFFEWVRDITESKNTEEALQSTIKQKRKLLQELQHRVKNSFALIHSMVALMGNSSSSEDVKTALHDVNTKISAMSEIYTLLYANKSFDYVQLDEYLLKITESLPIMSNSIQVETSLTPLSINIQKAISLGLITSELMTNAIKHGVKDKKQGKIRVSFLKDNNSNGTILIKDNGIGFPINFEMKNSNSLGIQLVYSLIEQMKGTAEMYRENDFTCWKICFPI
ncbi:MAG: PAS domain S-box protein [Spirochaetia bacterium]